VLDTDFPELSGSYTVILRGTRYGFSRSLNIVFGG
jgi:hypothetical protein